MNAQRDELFFSSFSTKCLFKAKKNEKMFTNVHTQSDVLWCNTLFFLCIRDLFWFLLLLKTGKVWKTRRNQSEGRGGIMVEERTCFEVIVSWGMAWQSLVFLRTDLQPSLPLSLPFPLPYSYPTLPLLLPYSPPSFTLLFTRLTSSSIINNYCD